MSAPVVNGAVDVENGRNSNFEGLVTLTLTFDRAIRHIVLHNSSTCTYILNFIQIEETFCGRTDVRTDGRTDGRTDISPLYIIRSTLGSRPKNYQNQSMLVETTACQSWRVFMRHSVVTLVGEKSRTSLHVKVTGEGHFQRVPVIYDFVLGSRFLETV